jgi:hypothetical protein
MHRPTLTVLALVLLASWSLLWRADRLDAQGQGTVNARIQDGNGIKVPLGAAAKAASLPVVLPTDQATLTTPLGVQLSTGAAALIGQQTMAASLPVVIASNQGAVPTIPGSATAFLAGQQAVTASAVALAANGAKGVCVKALVDNGIKVYIGPSGVSITTGDELAAGDGRCYPLDNTSRIFVIASTTGSSVSWSAWQ